MYVLIYVPYIKGVLAIIDSIKELTDISATQDEVSDLVETCRKIPGVKAVISLSARKSGPYLFVDTVIGVAGIYNEHICYIC